MLVMFKIVINKRGHKFVMFRIFESQKSFVTMYLSISLSKIFRNQDILCFLCVLDPDDHFMKSRQLKGASSLKSSLANAIRCLNHWILAPTSVSGNYDFHFREGRVDLDSAREPSDVTSFGNVTAFFIFPLTFQL